MRGEFNRKERRDLAAVDLNRAGDGKVAAGIYTDMRIRMVMALYHPCRSDCAVPRTFCKWLGWRGEWSWEIGEIDEDSRENEAEIATGQRSEL